MGSADEFYWWVGPVFQFTALDRYRLAQVGAMFNKVWANGPPLVALNLETVVMAAGSRELNGRSAHAA